ncbi:MAG: Maf family protein [Bacteriovoracaceae bacterium]|nr:Maf family protein [Bacteriovoracaceae bacterium]
MKLPLILASTSVYRKKLLERLHYPFTCEKPLVEESSYKLSQFKPIDVARALAREKALEVSKRFPGHLIIGGDQVVALENQILSKPGSIEFGISQLLKLQNQTHELHCAVHLLGPGIDTGFVETVKLKMRPLNFNQAKEYIELDEPLDCAGSYKLESRGIKLFESIEGGDHDAIVGLPLMRLQNELLNLGFELFDKIR